MNKRVAPKPAAAEAEPIAAVFARFADGFDAAAVPDRVLQRAKLHILDALGIGLASTAYDFGQHTANGIAGLAGPGEYPVIGMALRLPLRDSVQLNGTLIHGLDFDDTHSGAVTHITASVWPTVLALGLRQGVDGRAALAAYVLGVETAARIGIAAEGGFHAKGFHPTGMVGVFGCAIAAGWLLDLSPGQLSHAQGIALSTAAGNQAFLDDGAWTKRMHPGWAGVGGITAAALAKQGFQGPRRPYEGPNGLYRSYMPDDAKVDTAGIGADLGAVWELENIAVKPYPACHFNHAFADAALALRAEHGFDLDQVEGITARIAAGQVPVVCEPEAQKKRPSLAYEAQFSVHYIIAASLVRGRFTLAELEPDALADPAILRLADKVGYEVDPDSAYPRYYSGAVEVRLTDGRRLAHREQQNRGSDARPLSADEIVAKFRDNAGRAVSARRAGRVLDAVMALDRAGDLDELADAVSLD